MTKEVLAGYYILECADLDEALQQAARLPMAPWTTIEMRPVMPAEEWLNTARRAGVELSDEDVGTPGVSGGVKPADPVSTAIATRFATSARSCWPP